MGISDSLPREGPRCPDLARTRGFPTSRAGRFHQGGKPAMPSLALSRYPTPQGEVIKRLGGNTPSQLASAPPPPGRCPPQRSPYCHTGPAPGQLFLAKGKEK